MTTAAKESIIVQFTFNETTKETDLATIELPRLKWIWKVNKKSFEHVHGMYRVARLIPDKLATSRCIAFEDTDMPTSEHHFLIDLVIDLIERHYLTKAESDASLTIPADSKIHRSSLKTLLGYPDIELFESNLSPELNQERLRVLETFDPRPTSSSMFDIMCKMIDELRLAKEITTVSEFDEASRKILHLADGILSGCQAYLQFVHPVMVYVRRLRHYDDELATEEIVRLSREYEKKAYKTNHLTNQYP